MNPLLRWACAATASILGVGIGSCVGGLEPDGVGTDGTGADSTDADGAGSVRADPSGPPRDEERMRTSLAGIRSKFSAVEQVGTEALLVKLRESEVVLVDVRRRDEFEVSHLPGAIHVDMASSDEAFLRALPEDRDVIVYCSIGYRSAVVAERMRVAGRANVSNYLGSIFAWANAGHPLERAGGQAAATVHPYDAAWGALLEPSRRYPID